MSTTPTRLPVPSEKPQDLKFNSGKIDEFVTSLQREYEDRFGNKHYTIEGLRWVAQKAIAAFGYITLKSFQLGAPLPNNELTLPNQVLQDETDGEYYRWDGEFPKVVPAGSTPDSTGGKGLGAWVGVGDASLRSDLAQDTGSENIGTRAGKSVQDELDRLISTQVLTPELYGAAAVTDHTSIFKQMLADAKAQGKSVRATGNYVLTASPSDPISIEVDADFSKSTITCSTNDGNNENFGNTSILFKIPQEAIDKTSLFGSVAYSRGMKKTGVTGLNGWLGFTSTDVWLQRKANAAATPLPQYKIEVNETDQNGVLSYPNYFSYTAKPTVAYKPFTAELKFQMPSVTLDSAGLGWVVFCERNNVNILGGVIKSKNNGFAMTFVEFNRCARGTLNEYSLDAAFPETYQGGYTVLLTQCSSIDISNINSLSGWSGIDGNYYRGLSVRDSKLLTVGGHCGVSDVFVQNCEIINHCNGMGWGTWTALNCHHNLNLDKTVEDFWSTKYDYNNSWDGNVIVRDLKVTLHSACTGHYVVSALEPKADHSMIGCCPDILIENVEYDIANTSNGMDIRTLNLGVSAGNNFEQYQMLPQIHTVRDISFGGGSTRFLNNTNYRPVYNARNYSLITSAQFSTISTGRGRYTLLVENINCERLGALNNAQYYNVAYIDGFPFTTYGVKQDVSVQNANHCAPRTSAWTDMNIRVANQRMNRGYVDNAVARTSVSYNKVTFQNCEIYGIGDTPSGGTYRSGIFDFIGTIFRWESESDKAPTSPNGMMGSLFGTGAGVAGRMQSCVIGVVPSGSTLDATFKSRVLTAYINSGVYTSS